MYRIKNKALQHLMIMNDTKVGVYLRPILFERIIANGGAAAPVVEPSVEPAAVYVNVPPPAADYVNVPPPAADYVNGPHPYAAYVNVLPPAATGVNVPPPAAAGVNVPPSSDAALATLLKAHGDAMAAKEESDARKDAHITALETALVDAVVLAAKLKVDYDHSEHLRHKNDGKTGAATVVRLRNDLAESRESHAETQASLESSRALLFEEKMGHNFTRGTLIARNEDLKNSNAEINILKADLNISKKRTRAIAKELDSCKKYRNG